MQLLERQAFNAACFDRDAGRCVNCGVPAVDAHHILDRKLFADGGYYLSNAASVCGACHLKAEQTLITVEALRDACGIMYPALPDGFDVARRYDKWGNEILEDGSRSPGPLFHDDGARKALATAGLLYSGVFPFETLYSQPEGSS